MNSKMTAQRLTWLRPIALPFAAALVLQGCAGGVSSRDVAGYDGYLARGDYSGAAALAMSAGPVGADGASNNLLWSLNAGAAMVQAGDTARAVPVLDRAEAMMTNRDASAMNDLGQYHAKTYDAMMVNAYKAVAMMSSGHPDQARTEFRRVEDRQSRAEQDFQREAATSRRGGAEAQGAMQAAQANPAYRSALQDMSRYGGYQPFINPAALYLSALFMLNTPENSPEKARQAFQTVRGIVGPGPLLDGDIALAAAGGHPKPRTWVVLENGQGSTLRQYSFTVPIPIMGRRTGVSVVTVAMPALQENAPATAGLLVGPQGVRTTVVGNFDYVQRSEFARRYPSILASAIAEVVLKAAAQNAAAQEKTGVALLLTQVASQISTADTRSWTALPKDFEAARIEIPKDGMVQLRTIEGVDLGMTKVPTDASSIIYVKAFRPGSRPAVQVLRF